MGEDARFKNGHAHVEMRVFKTLACRKMLEASSSILVDSVSVRFRNASVSKKCL